MQPASHLCIWTPVYLGNTLTSFYMLESCKGYIYLWVLFMFGIHVCLANMSVSGIVCLDACIWQHGRQVHFNCRQRDNNESCLSRVRIRIRCVTNWATEFTTHVRITLVLSLSLLFRQQLAYVRVNIKQSILLLDTVSTHLEGWINVKDAHHWGVTQPKLRVFKLSKSFLVVLHCTQLHFVSLPVQSIQL